MDIVTVHSLSATEHMETSSLDARSLVLGVAVVSSAIALLVLANHRRLRRSRLGSLHVFRCPGNV